MTDLFEKISGSQDKVTELLNKIANAVPGFDGYFERKNRRASDKVLRTQIADKLRVQVSRIGDLQQDFASNGELTVLDDLETAVTKLQTVIDKIKFASYGYAGIFDAIKVKEGALLALYEFDVALLEKTDEVGHAIDNVETSMGTDGQPASIRHLIALAREMADVLAAREHVIVDAASVDDGAADDLTV